MTDAQHHVIGTRAIQVRTASRARAQPLMDRVGELWRTELAAIADEVFSTYAPPGQGWRIEALDLSLGTIAEAELAAEMPRRFRAALEAELRRQLTLGLTERARPLRGEASLLEVLEHVLLHGFIPWWGRVDRGFDPVRELVALLQREPLRVAALARKIGRQQRVRVRLVHWLDDPAIARLISAVAGGDAEFVLRYAEDLQSRQEEQGIVAAAREEFRQAKWEAILAYLLADRGSRFNTKAFLRATLRDLAAHFRTDYAALLRELVDVVHGVDLVWREASLPQLLDELWREDVLRGRAAGDAMPENLGEMARDVYELLSVVLREASDAPLPAAELGRLRVQWQGLSSAERSVLVARLAMAWGLDRVMERLQPTTGATIAGEIAKTTVQAVREEAGTGAVSEDERHLAQWPALPRDERLVLIRRLVGDWGAERVVARLAPIVGAAVAREIVEAAARALHSEIEPVRTSEHEFGFAEWAALSQHERVAWVRNLLSIWGKEQTTARLAAVEGMAAAGEMVRLAAKTPGTEIEMHSTTEQGQLAAEWPELSPGERLGWVMRLTTLWGRERMAERLARIGDAALAQEIAHVVAEVSAARLSFERAVNAWGRFFDEAWAGEEERAAKEDSTLAEWLALAPELRVAVADSHGRGLAVDALSDVEAAQVSTGAWSLRELLRCAPARNLRARNLGEEQVMPALRHLLETGTLPAVAGAPPWQARPVEWLELVLARYGEAIPPLLRQWASGTRLTTVLAAHFEDAVLETIVETVEPAAAEDIADFVRTARRGEPPLVGANPRSEAFRRSTWTLIFDYLLSDRGSVFNQRAFLEYGIEQIAARQRLGADAVLEYLLAAAQAESRLNLLRDLREIAERRLRQEPVTDSAVTKPEGSAAVEERGAGVASDAAMERPTAWSKLHPEAAFIVALADGERLRRSRVAALRLWYFLLAPRANSRDPRLDARLPELWVALRREPALSLAREILRTWRAPPRAIVQNILAHGGEVVLETLVFGGEPSALTVWRRALQACVTDPALARIIGVEAVFRARAWHALLESWREGGGRNMRHVAAWFARWLVAAVGVPEAPRQDAAVPRHRQAPPAGGKTPVAVVDEPIAVENAGLVLLAPFFPELHRRCGLLEDGVFKDFRENQTAVHLLQYLAAGAARAHEYTLVLNKILCGLDPALPVVPRIELDRPTLAIADALLENVARQFPRGAKISIDGLRGTYLLRSGRLKRGARGAWSLKVDAKGWDVLLAELTWSFGRIQPAWMPAPLLVDWI